MNIITENMATCIGLHVRSLLYLENRDQRFLAFRQKFNKTSQINLCVQNLRVQLGERSRVIAHIVKSDIIRKKVRKFYFVDRPAVRRRN